MYNRSVSISGGQSGKWSELAQDDETHHGFDTKLMDDRTQKKLMFLMMKGKTMTKSMIIMMNQTRIIIVWLCFLPGEEDGVYLNWEARLVLIVIANYLQLPKAKASVDTTYIHSITYQTED